MINFQIDRLDYYRRHARTTLSHLTWRKAANLALNLFELRVKTPTPRSLPLYLKLEPTPLCHMGCLGCGHRDPLFKKQFDPSMKMGLEELLGHGGRDTISQVLGQGGQDGRSVHIALVVGGEDHRTTQVR